MVQYEAVSSGPLKSKEEMGYERQSEAGRFISQHPSQRIFILKMCHFRDELPNNIKDRTLLLLQKYSKLT